MTNLMFALKVNARVPLVAAPEEGHNRWHPDINPLLTVTPGEDVLFETRDGLDVQIVETSTAADVEAMDLTRGHPLTGPVFVDGAEPGDLLDVEIREITPADFGFTVIVPGFGVLAADFESPYIVKWSIADGVARSAEIPGVAIPGAPFVGVLGVAPSHERLQAFASREYTLIEKGFDIPVPEPRGAVPGNGDAGAYGLRTIPPRETGGNLDVRQLGVGSRITLPVDVAGALFSLGDLHFAQGDGESCGVAIEMSGSVIVRFSLRKPSEQRWAPRNPTFEYVERRQADRSYVATTGISVDRDGNSHYLDLNVAANMALAEMIAYLVSERGFTREQAYVLTSVAADLRISEAVDSPNALVSACLPLDIFI